MSHLQWIVLLLCCGVLQLGFPEHVFAADADTLSPAIVRVEETLNNDPGLALKQAEQALAHLPLKDSERPRWLAIASEAAGQLVLPDKALRYANEGLSFTEQGLSAAMQQRLSIAQAQAYELTGNTQDSLRQLMTVIATLEAGSFEPALMIDALIARSNVYNDLVDYRAALADLLRAYEMAPKDNARNVRADVAASIGNIYAELHDATHAEQFYQEAIADNEAKKSWVKLSIAEYSLAIMMRRQTHLAEARDYFTRSLKHSGMSDDQQGVAYAQFGLGTVALDEKKYDEAEKWYLKALPVFDAAHDWAPQSTIAVGRGRIAYLRKQYPQAMQFAETGKALTDKTGDRDQRAKALELIVDIYVATGDFRNAYQTSLLAHELKDQLQLAQSDSSLAEFRVRFDTERQEQQNSLLQKQNELNAAQLAAQQQTGRLYIVSVITLLLILVFMIYVFYKNHQVRTKLASQALTDDLTGIANRRHIMQVLQHEFDRARRYGSPLSIAMLDLDHFKMINDRFGHDAGDEVLQYFANMVRNHLRQTDSVGRVGGEEFIAVFPHTKLEDAHLVVERLRNATHELNCPKLRGEKHPSVSIGLATQSGSDKIVEQLVKRADEAVYAAKQRGRDRTESA